MIFRKINKDTVCCTLSEDDMREYGLEVEDFLKNREKVHTFLEEIVQQAKEEVGYEVTNGILAIQIMPLPKNGLAITFSEKMETDIKELFEHIKDEIGADSHIKISDLMEQIQDIGEEQKAEVIDRFIKNILSEKANLTQEEKENYKQKGKVKEAKPKLSSLKIYCFDCLDDIEYFCSIVPDNKPIKSKLYKNGKNGHYYIILEKGKLSLKLFHHICDIAMEFASFISDDITKLAYIEEHYTCIIPKKAVSIMKMIGKN